MLKHLLDFALKKGLVTEAGFAPETARWSIACNDNGLFLDVIPIGETKKGREFPACPKLKGVELKQFKGEVLLDLGSIVQIEKEKQPARCFKDYKISLAKDKLPAGVELLELL